MIKWLIKISKLMSRFCHSLSAITLNLHHLKKAQIGVSVSVCLSVVSTSFPNLKASKSCAWLDTILASYKEGQHLY